jgi:hypothetical protein
VAAVDGAIAVLVPSFLAPGLVRASSGLLQKVEPAVITNLIFWCRRRRNRNLIAERNLRDPQAAAGRLRAV